KRFNSTIDQGLNILNGYIDELESSDRDILDGESAFKLYDTYGFPLDLTREILEEHGLDVDGQEFNVHMEMQREKARSSREKTDYTGKDGQLMNLLSSDIDTVFVGYDTLKSDSK